MKANHLAMAETHHDLGNNLSMWQSLLTWVQAEEIYGEHWDKLKEKNT
jgi:two-component sensor histidine kinase